jgi:DNA-binding IclR family transcriptional regulator
MQLPLNQGAAGKVLLAFDAARKAQDNQALEPVTVSYGERDPVCAALACPVFGPFQQIYGAISLSGPRERFTPTAVNRMADLLFIAGADVTRSMGGTWPWSLPSMRSLKLNRS